MQKENFIDWVEPIADEVFGTYGIELSEYMNELKDWHSNNVPIKQAIQNILEVEGFDYIEGSNKNKENGKMGISEKLKQELIEWVELCKDYFNTMKEEGVADSEGQINVRDGLETLLKGELGKIDTEKASGIDKEELNKIKMDFKNISEKELDYDNKNKWIGFLKYCINFFEQLIDNKKGVESMNKTKVASKKELEVMAEKYLQAGFDKDLIIKILSGNNDAGIILFETIATGLKTALDQYNENTQSTLNVSVDILGTIKKNIASLEKILVEKQTALQNQRMTDRQEPTTPSKPEEVTIADKEEATEEVKK